MSFNDAGLKLYDNSHYSELDNENENVNELESDTDDSDVISVPFIELIESYIEQFQQ